jgi:energy-coupling factor transport system ATP-binding protein
LEIRAEHLGFTYNPGTPLEVRVLEDVNFVLRPGAVLGILGGTGSGKTTLIKHLNGLLVPTSGRLLLDGKDSASYGSRLGSSVGVVFQRPERQLFEETVFLDVSFVLRRFSDLAQEEIVARAAKACSLLGLDMERVGQRSPLALSDGEKRKAAIAGVLVNEPETLVLDEPGVGLDPPALCDLIRVLQQMKFSGDRSIVIVSHDMEPFLPLLDSLMVLSQGRVAACGSPARVCEMLGDVPAMRDLLPSIGLVIHDLRKAGVPLLRNEFRPEALADQLAALAGRRVFAS